ncbi:MAG: aspartate kinase [Bacteroidetes bacterium]|nr:aspartate kinase [Bacteroidota bacterium]
MDIKVFKFGGASVNSAAGVRNVASIIRRFPDDNIAMVVSAMGKTTNALEELLKFFMASDAVAMARVYKKIRDYHMMIMDELFGPNKPIGCMIAVDGLQKLNDYLQARLLNTNLRKEYDFEYDQIVSNGEIFSSAIVYSYLLSLGIMSELLDARELIKTDSTYRDAAVDWELTERNLRKEFDFLFSSTFTRRIVVVIQGFIGGDADGNATTLGREGSDYTAAIVAHSMKTREVTIWKDVPGVMNADPKWFPDARKLKRLSYLEAIELAYYGGSVIHPKTIKPLENANIVLRVKSFLKPHLEGTTIENLAEWKVPVPIYILKRNQVLISISPRDFSFILEENLSQIFSILARNRVKVNLMQNSAVSFTVCVDSDHLDSSGSLAMLQENYSIRYNEDVELLTIRHYTPAAIKRITKGRMVLMEQKTRNTVHLVMKAK